MMIKQLSVTFSVQDVLSAIWYSDGSGCRTSVDVLSAPSEFKVRWFCLDEENQTVTIDLERLED